MYGAGAAFLPGADPIWSEPELAPGPRIPGAAQKSGGSVTLLGIQYGTIHDFD